MDLPEDLQKPFDRLVSYYVRLDEKDGEQRKSGESAFEAMMGKMSKSARHRPVFSHDGRGIVVARGTDIACSCTAHCYNESHFVSPDRVPFRVSNTPQLSRGDAIGTALRGLDARTRRLLERLARDPLPWYRVPFGKPFKSVGGERYAAPLRGVQKEHAHGPGNLAEETRVATDVWPGQQVAREVNELGKRIQHCNDEGNPLPGRSVATSNDRALARAIEAFTGPIAKDALYAFKAAVRDVDTRPVVLKRVGS